MFQKKLMSQFQENCWKEGRMEGWTDGRTEPNSKDPSSQGCRSNKYYNDLIEKNISISKGKNPDLSLICNLIRHLIHNSIQKYFNPADLLKMKE